MKKILFLMLLAVCTTAAQAQTFGRYAFGVKGVASLGADVKNMGVGITMQTFSGDHWRYQMDAEHFFKQNHLSLWELSAKLNYVFAITPDLGVYPLAGVSALLVNQKYQIVYPEDLRVPKSIAEEWHSKEDIQFAVNAGAGIEYYPKLNFKVYGELRYRFGADVNAPLLTLGIAYVL